MNITKGVWQQSKYNDESKQLCGGESGHALEERPWKDWRFQWDWKLFRDEVLEEIKLEI